MEYDPYSYEIDEDPYPVYAWMRDEAPAYYNERLDFWALTRFDDCHAALIDWETYSSAKGTVLELMGDEALSGAMIIFMDPPRQTRVRNLVSKAFTPRRMSELEPRIRALATEHLDKLVGRSEFDVVQEFTAKLPMDVISSMLGIPREDRDMVRAWSNAQLHRDAGSPLPNAEGLAAMTDLLGYFADHMQERRKRPRDDMMTLLIEAEVPGEDRLGDDEIRSFFNLLATAGNETVTKLLATVFELLARHPDQRRSLVDDPSLAAGAIDETLRYDPPSHYQGRVTTREVELHGSTLPAGARVLIINAATGRDERKYPDAENWDVRRQFDLHLNFGYGQHICLGKNLALRESRIATTEFLKRFPEYEVAGFERIHSSNVRGLSSLQVRV